MGHAALKRYPLHVALLLYGKNFGALHEPASREHELLQAEESWLIRLANVARACPAFQLSPLSLLATRNMARHGARWLQEFNRALPRKGSSTGLGM